MESEEQKEKKKKKPHSLKTFLIGGFINAYVKNGKGSLYVTFFYDGDSPILLGERESLWPEMTTNLFLGLYFLVHGNCSTSLCILQLFFSKTGAYVQWARAGNGRYVKHLGMSVNFFTFFLSFGWDGTML